MGTRVGAHIKRERMFAYLPVADLLWQWSERCHRSVRRPRIQCLPGIIPERETRVDGNNGRKQVDQKKRYGCQLSQVVKYINFYRS